MSKKLSGARAIDRVIKKALKPKKVKEPKQPKPKTPKPKKTRTKKEPTEAELRAKRQKEQQKRIAKIARDYGREVRQKAIAEKKAAREALLKEKRSVYYKRKNQIKRYGEKALALNADTQRMVDNFRRKGYQVDNTKQLQDVKERIEKAMSNERPPERVVELIKEYTKTDTYDYIKVTLPIRTEEKLSDDEVDVADNLEVSFKEIRLARRRQVLSPDKIEDKEAQILAIIGQTTPYTQAASLPDADDEKQIEQFKKKFNKVRDISIGGNSTLINDLSYTYDALWEGRRFVEDMQKIMSDPKEFVLIEAWYQSNEEDAVQARDDIGSAIRSSWYAKFKDFSATIIEFINKLPSLSKEAEDILSNYSDILEVSADEVSGF